MSQPAYNLQTIAANLVTEDDEPVDNLLSEKNQRLLTETLYASWQPPTDENAPDEARNLPRKFMASANVGVFFSAIEKPLVPDVFVSLDVEPNEEWLADEHRSYFVWAFGKVPEAVIEIVSNRKGGEVDKKLRTYARWGINYYAVFDPFDELRGDKLSVYEIGFGKRYQRRRDFAMPDLGLGLTLWRGKYENLDNEWLRWTNTDGELLLTGTERAAFADERAAFADERAAFADERANVEAERANVEAERANAEAERANAEAERAERLAAKLRELGIDLTQI